MTMIYSKLRRIVRDVPDRPWSNQKNIASVEQVFKEATDVEIREFLKDYPKGRTQTSKYVRALMAMYLAGNRRYKGCKRVAKMLLEGT